MWLWLHQSSLHPEISPALLSEFALDTTKLSNRKSVFLLDLSFPT